MIAEKQVINGFITDDPMSAPLQGQDSIVVESAIEEIWPLIADSKRLEDWGPPVIRVEILNNPGQPEKVGSYRRVTADMNGKKGYFIEKRIEHIEGKRMRFVMEDESFGLSKIMKDTGASLELEAMGSQKTRVIFSFYHQPKGVLGHLMNKLVVLRQQRTNRLLALDALKSYAESIS